MSSRIDFKEACNWWSDLPAIWTPLGWREHMFRFNVFWNGTILAEPALTRRTAQYSGQGVQLGFAPSIVSDFREHGHPYLQHDDGQMRQGWVDHDAPVLWTEWWRDGLLIRQYAFAHLAGGGDTVSGVEPLYLWLRLEVERVCEALPVEERHGMHLLFHRGHVVCTMSMRDNIRFAKCGPYEYPRNLTVEPEGYGAQGLRVLEEGGKVRLSVVGGVDGVVASFFGPDEKEPRPCQRLHLQFPAKKGAKLDILLPMLPTEAGEFEREMALGYEGALQQSGSYWRRITASRVSVGVPEQEINEAIKQSVRFSNVLSERSPESGKVCKTSGSWAYADLWTTPGAMDLIMMMDMLGHHQTVRRYLDIFRDEQGSVKPSGDVYERHDGYLSTPAAYKSIDWLSDNGAVLWTLCKHYLLSGDKEYLAEFIETIVKSCDWIKSARALRNHGGYAGVLPPAVATDERTVIQSVWVAGWNYLGLTAAVKVLREAGHPRAAEFAAEAADYRRCFVEALRHKCESMPMWHDRRGKARRFVPTALAGDKRSESRHGFYLDAGPLFLVFAGLLPASDPLMRDTLAWFREGPQTEFFRKDTNCWQVPVLHREMSSCEPCYSWNMFHSWQLGDREAFLTGMYSLFAGALSRQTWISCETRGGMTGNVFAAPLAIYLMRLSMIDDQIEPGELHLLRLASPVWLASGESCEFVHMPTEYGPVTLKTRVSRGGQLKVEFTGEFRRLPGKKVLHIPPGVKGVTVNGAKTDVSSGKVELA